MKEQKDKKPNITIESAAHALALSIWSDSSSEDIQDGLLDFADSIMENNK